MTPSKACADLIKSFEACRLKAYLPTPNDVATLGWGSTGPDIKMGMTWTQEQADEQFARDLAKFGLGVSRLLGSAPTTQGQFDACCSLAFNIGLGAFGSSTLCRFHLAGQSDQAVAQFARWNLQKGQVLNGLTRRRTAEAALYRGSVK